MELIAGEFRLTELGLIPRDWEVLLLESLATKIGSGITPTGGESVYKEDGRPFIRSQNIGWGNLLLDDIAFIDETTHQTFPNTEIKLNDVFLNISGASIGRSSFANEKLVGGNVNQHVCIIRTIETKLNPVFLNLFLLSKKGQKQIDSFQSGGNRQGLNIGQIRTFQIPLPSTIKEQTAIATAISDADALISSLEKLIAKKRNIKQGAMQKLLQPKEGWEVKRLGEIFKISSSDSKSSYVVESGNYIIMDMGAISSDGTILKHKRTNFSKDLLCFEDLVMPKDDIGGGNIIGKVGFIDEDNKYILGDHVYKLELIQRDVYSLFFYFLINSVYVNKNFRAKASGSAQLGLGRKSVSEQILYFPKAKDEQTEIASILFDMNTEIVALETKLEKFSNIKLGMMQNLLTGKIRLV